MRSSSLGLVFLILSAAALAQERSLKPMTGSGNPELYKLAEGYRFADALYWDDGEFQDGWATSVLPAEGKAPKDAEAVARWSTMYAPRNLTDEDPATAWFEGAAGTGVGEAVMVPLPEFPDYGKRLRVWNGFQRSARLFTRNCRVKEARVFLLSAYPDPSQYGTYYREVRVIGTIDAVLKDSMGPQELALPAFDLPPKTQDGKEPQLLAAVKILSVYPGTHYQDTGLSGLRVFK